MFHDAANGFELITPQIEFHPHGHEDNSLPELKLASLVVFFISLLVPAAGVFSLFFGLSFGVAFDFIITMQLLSQMPLMRIYMPSGLMYLFKYLQYYMFKDVFWSPWDIE